jgi:hypothetical protein
MNRPDLWICVLVSYRYLITHGFDQLGELFTQLMGDDYIDHHPLDPSVEEADDTSSCYVLLRCRSYKEYIGSFSSCPYLRGVLNSYKDVYELLPEEISAIRKVPTNVVKDHGHTINRTGFFMPGDIVHVKKGHLSHVQGIVVKHEKKNLYRVYFRFFMRSFNTTIDADMLDFVSSIFRFYKFPVKRHSLANSKKLANEIAVMYRRLLQQQLKRQLIA